MTALPHTLSELAKVNLLIDLHVAGMDANSGGRDLLQNLDSVQSFHLA